MLEAARNQERGLQQTGSASQPWEGTYPATALMSDLWTVRHFLLLKPPSVWYLVVEKTNMLCEAVKFAKLFSLTSLSVEQDAVASHTYLIGFFWGLNSICVLQAKLLQLCLSLCFPVDCSPPVFSVRGILQARILAWAAIPSFRWSSWAPGNLKRSLLMVSLCCSSSISRLPQPWATFKFAFFSETVELGSSFCGQNI